MTYSGSTQATQAREALAKVLEDLQNEGDLPEDVVAVMQNIAAAMGELFDATSTETEKDGVAQIEAALGHLSQTLALLQDVRGNHKGVEQATDVIAESMGLLYPLTNPESILPQPDPAQLQGTIAGAAAKASNPPWSLRPPVQVLEREPVALEANIGATTESNFFVGFSGEVSEGGVFLATFEPLPLGAPVDLLVTLPGGFEFRTKAVCEFVRDPVHGGIDAQPGLGLRFRSLGGDARELVLRFVRKRPPMFFE